MHQPQDTAVADLRSLLPYLEAEYYTRIERLCERAGQHIAKLHGSNVHQAASLYTGTGKYLIDQAMQYLDMHRRVLVPYIRQLLKKKEAGHDCRTCSSACAVRHTAQISGLWKAHTKIRETLSRLQVIDASASQELLHRDAYGGLCHEMAQLYAALTELFYLEETELIPKIREAQKTIHAIYTKS